MNLVNSYTSWQPLEEVIVGSVYPPDYFDYIRDVKVRDQLQQILVETAEDLDNLQKLLQDYGATVHRPGLVDKNKFVELQQDSGNYSVPFPPLTPRDWQITLGDRLLRIRFNPVMDSVCERYGDAVVYPHKNGYDRHHIMHNCTASCIVRVGTDIFFDNSEWMMPEQVEWIQQNVLDNRYRIRQAKTNGHGDSVFAILKPGVIITSMHDHDIDYSREFPGWDICRVDDSTIDACQEIGHFIYEGWDGRWYVHRETPDPAFATYVDTYLAQWTGFVKETVFDVNCLVLDEQHVVFSNYNKKVFDFCRKHHIEPIVCDMRHKYFFDGGTSCVTQDIRRRGGLETYL